MNHRSQVHVIGLALFVIGSIVIGSIQGCGGNVAPKQSTESEVKRLGIMFMKFLGRNRGKSPANREELETFIKATPPAELTSLGIEDINEIFHSSRDGEDLVIRYGIVVPPPGQDPTVIAYEQVGVSGKHMVVYGTGGIEEITEDRLKELVPDVK